MDRILCWNVRGLNKHSKQINVRQLIQSHNIKLFSLLETRVKAPRMGDLYLTVCPNWCFTTNLSCHYNGRIILAWDPDVFKMDIIHMGSQLIHTYITVRSSDKGFFCSFIYGFNTPAEREPLWSTLSSFASLNQHAW